MKAIVPILAAVLCIFVLVIGKLQWNEKTKVTAAISPVASDTTANKATPVKQYVNPELLAYTKNWPQQAQDTFKKTLENGHIYKIAIVGSQALGDKDQGWASQLKDALMNLYGDDHLDVSIYSFDKTSSQFLKDHDDEEVSNDKADLILFEPFILNDNGYVTIEDNHQNILSFIKQVKDKNKNAVVILQPSNPIYQATIYPDQVKQLQKFAEDNDIPFMDHWSAWPDSNSDEIKQYIDSNSNPTLKGNQVWFEFLKKYFIAE